MQKIRYGLIVLLMLLSLATSATAEVSIGIGLPNVSIGINLPLFPELVPVPGYPVYYAPRMDANYFFYDGMYWVYQDDNWYASSWYNGPWGFVEPEVVPLFILRVPVRYYRQPPVYFREWRSDAPPRWGQHWGHGWEQRRGGWDRWNRSSVPSRAPLPAYQRNYSGDRYPQVEQQHRLRGERYRYQPRDRAVRQHFQQQIEHRAPAPAQRERQEAPSARSPRQDDQRQQREQHQQQQNDQRQQHQQQQNDQRQQQKQQREQQKAPRAQEREQRPHDRGESQEPNRGRGQGQNRDEERGRGRDK